MASVFRWQQYLKSQNKKKKQDILVNLFGHGQNINRTILLGAWGRVHEKKIYVIESQTINGGVE